MKNILLTIFALLSLAFVGLAIFAHSGAYPVGADVPHFKATTDLLTYIRENSIESASAQIKVPDLSDPEMLIRGGSGYAAMCASCHLRPAQNESDLSRGLYPAPPNLANRAKERLSNRPADYELARQFWIIKHGIKASGMPAWGITHDDQRIWDMVAFLQKLPQLTPEQYQIITGRTETATPNEPHKEH